MSRRDVVLDWIDHIGHSAVRAALLETQLEFRLPDNWEIGKMHPGHLLFFIEVLARHTA